MKKKKRFFKNTKEGEEKFLYKVHNEAIEMKRKLADTLSVTPKTSMTLGDKAASFTHTFELSDDVVSEKLGLKRKRTTHEDGFEVTQVQPNEINAALVRKLNQPSKNITVMRDGQQWNVTVRHSKNYCDLQRREANTLAALRGHIRTVRTAHLNTPLTNSGLLMRLKKQEEKVKQRDIPNEEIKGRVVTHSISIPHDELHEDVLSNITRFLKSRGAKGKITITSTSKGVDVQVRQSFSLLTKTGRTLRAVQKARRKLEEAQKRFQRDEIELSK